MPLEVVVLGMVTGLGGGLAACGLVLTYRASRVLNLAHGQIGILVAIAFAVAVQRGWPYWPTLALALCAGATVAAGVELLVIRRLRRFPPPMTLVATLGVGQVCLYAATEVARELLPGRALPQPPGPPELRLPALTLEPASTALGLVGVPVALGLAWLLAATPLGSALRAAAANRDGARLIGIPAPRLATATWGVAGALSVLTAVFLLPTPGYAQAAAAGPGLLVSALAAAAVAGMTSLPLALAAGVLIGVAQQVAIWHLPDRGSAELVALAVLAAALALRPGAVGRLGGRGSWTAFERWRPPPATARGDRLVRWSGPVLGACALVAGLGITGLLDEETQVVLAVTAALGLVALSVWLVTGLAGELVLGQVAVAGVGAVAGEAVGAGWLGLMAGAGAGALAAVLAGAAAVRGQGFGLAALSLTFAVACAGWLFPQTWAVGGTGRVVKPLMLGSRALDDPGEVLAVGLLAVASAVWLLSRLARAGPGLRLLASRDDDPTARAFGLRPPVERLWALALGGSLAGMGGMLLGHAVGRLTPGLFGVTLGVDVAAVAVLGGLAVAAGPLLGALLVLALPELLDLPAAGLAATAAGWLAIVVLLPGGLVSLAAPVHRRLLGRAQARAGKPPAPDRRPPPSRRSDGLALEVHGIVKRYGAVTALDGLSLKVAPGHALGVMGPNGAGKTTLVDVITGFARPDAGRVVLGGRDVSRAGAPARARAGLIRTFQDPVLFPTLTVEEVLRLAARRGGPPAEDLLAMFGLEPWRDVAIRRVSTGTRRLVELAAAVGLRPQALVLDEPSAGLAQPEIPPLAAVLRDLREALRMSLLLVDHDPALVEAVCDGVIRLEAGRRASAAELAMSLRSAPAPEHAAPVLRAHDLSIAYGGTPVLEDITLEVARGEVVALVGANGAGKSTLLRTLAGLVSPRAGSVELDGRPLDGAGPEARARLGIGLVLGGAAVFGPVRVADSLALAALAAGLPPDAADAAVREALLRFPELAARSRVHAGSLSGGEQHLLAIAQILVRRPSVLLIDELGLGLAPPALRRVSDLVAERAEAGTAVVFADQSVDLARALAHRICVLDGGRVAYDGDPAGLDHRHDLLRARRLVVP